VIEVEHQYQLCNKLCLEKDYDKFNAFT
jgi:hypothetical protein